MPIKLAKVNSKINYQHPFLKGLKGYYLCNDSGSQLFDYSGNKNHIDLTNTTWVPEGIEVNANSEYGSIDNTGEQVVNEVAGTIIMYVRSYSSFSDNVIRTLFGERGAAASNGDFGFAKWGDNNFYILMTYAGPTDVYTYWNSSHFPNWETGQQLAIQWDMNNDIYNGRRQAVAVDGVYQSHDGTQGTTWTNYTISTPLGFLNDAATLTRDFNGVCSYMFIYDRVLPIEEIRAIYLDPEIVLKKIAQDYVFGKFYPNYFYYKKLLAGN